MLAGHLARTWRETGRSLLAASSSSPSSTSAILPSGTLTRFSTQRPPSVANSTTPKVEETTSANETEETKKPGLAATLRKYGTVGVATHFTLTTVSLSGWYMAVSAGLDVQNVLTSIGIDYALPEAGGKAGTFAIAYIAHKATMPFRIPVTLAAVPVVARFVGRKPTPTSDPKSPSGS